MKPGLSTLAWTVAGLVAGVQAPAAEGWHLRFLAEPGAESSRTGLVSDAAAPLSFAELPGAAYLFATDPSGPPRKLGRLPVDPDASHGAAAAAGVAFVATRDGAVSRWSSTTAADRTTLRWWREMGDRAASLTWDAPRVLVSTWNGRLTALGDMDGKPLWSADLGGKVDGGIASDGARLYAATKARSLVSLDASRGLVRWKVDLPGLAVQAPALAVETSPRQVYVGTREGRVAAFDSALGRSRWTAKVPARLTSGPCPGPGFVAAASEDGVVRAFDEGTGAVLWEAAGAAKGPATLLVQSVGGTTRLLCVSQVLAALDVSSGKRLSDYPEGARQELRKRFGDAMLEGEKTYSEAEKHQVEEREAFEIDGPVYGEARLAGRTLTFGTEEGWAYLFDADQLRPVWRYRAGSPVLAGPVWADGRILVGQGEEVVALDGKDGSVIWRRPLGADVESVAKSGDTAGAVAGGRLSLLRTSDGSFAAKPQEMLRAASPSVDGTWIADGGEGGLRLLTPPAYTSGEPWRVDGDRLGPIPLGTGWLVATRGGTVMGLTAVAPRIEAAWQASVGEPLLDIRAAGDRAILATASGAWLGFDPVARKVTWRHKPVPGERWTTTPEGAFVWAAGEMQVVDTATGEVRFAHKTGTPVVGAGRWGETLTWVDCLGRVYSAPATAGPPTLDAELGLLVEQAVAVDIGFVLKTAAGEIGLLEPSVAKGDPR